MNDLFSWMIENKDKLHPLILSCVFHYEFVFIHPFSDENGRTVRLWQNILLYNWKKSFEYLPIESQIYKYQNEYYKAIATPITPITQETLNINKLLDVMEKNKPLSACELMEKLNIKSRDTLRNQYLNPAIEHDLVKLTIPDKPTSSKQTYYKD